MQALTSLSSPLPLVWLPVDFPTARKLNLKQDNSLLLSKLKTPETTLFQIFPPNVPFKGQNTH
jgi:hypothetical protein